MHSLDLLKSLSNDSIIYPHSCTLNKTSVLAQDIYPEFAESIFSIYFSIYSLDPEDKYVTLLSVVDIKSGVGSANQSKIFESLDSQEYRDYMTSVFSIFKPFDRYVLNFDKEPYKMSDYYKMVEDWIDTLTVKEENEI